MFNFLRPKITVATHNGSFHADDVFAVATLSLWAEKEGKRIEVARTRDRKEIEKADIVVDVGDEYNPDKNRFDHHQKGGTGNHPGTQIPYASFGLVWKHFGEKICDKETAKLVEKKLILPIDAKDNGINVSKNIKEDVSAYTMNGEMFCALRFSKNGFDNSLRIAKLILQSEINLADKNKRDAKEVENQIQLQLEPEILILEKDLAWEKIAEKYKKIKMVVYPEPDTSEWRIETLRDNIDDFDTNRVLFPKNWRGLRDRPLQEVSGIDDAVFCHLGGFFAVAKTKEGAIKIARKALGNQGNML